EMMLASSVSSSTIRINGLGLADMERYEGTFIDEEPTDESGSMVLEEAPPMLPEMGATGGRDEARASASEAVAYEGKTIFFTSTDCQKNRGLFT
ncbi:MAG: hypothetical protein ACREIA_08130, partial [Opitutaceae bacterium]